MQMILQGSKQVVSIAMMDMKNKYQAYSAAAQTLAKTRQIVLLYDGAIRFVQQGKEAIQTNRIEDRYNLLMRASDIVHGLQSCLDFDNGGDIAKILYQFYTSINNRLFSIHHTNSLDACDEVIADLKQMRDVWYEIDMGTAAAAPGSDTLTLVAHSESIPSPSAI